jgi:hypothetical protein
VASFGVRIAAVSPRRVGRRRDICHEGSLEKTARIEMATVNTTGLNLAAKEHLVGGNPLTRLDALILFGVSNLPELVYEMRRDGFLINTRKIPFAAAMVRVNEHAVLKPPANLPIREIMLTEYRVSR